jgi:hypothetical protein
VEDEDDISSLPDMHDLVEPIFETVVSKCFSVMLGLSASHVLFFVVFELSCKFAIEDDIIVSCFSAYGSSLFCPKMEEF